MIRPRDSRDVRRLDMLIGLALVAVVAAAVVVIWQAWP